MSEATGSDVIEEVLASRTTEQHFGRTPQLGRVDILTTSARICKRSNLSALGVASPLTHALIERRSTPAPERSAHG